MNLSIDSKIFDLFPDLSIGVIVAKGIDNHGEKPQLLEFLKAEQESVKARYSLESYKEDEKLLAWREVYRAFGAKPKKYQCSIENLIRMILQGIELSHINTVVDLYNALSLKHTVPIGGDDLDKVEGDLVLTVAQGDEDFIKLNSDEIDHPKLGEVIYRDDKEVLCRRWNWRECDKSKMTEESTNVVLVVEGIPPMMGEQVQVVLEEMGGLVQEYCGGEVKTSVLDVEHPSLFLS